MWTYGLSNAPCSVFYYTIIPATLLAHRMALNGVLIAVVGTFVLVVGMNLFWCDPINKNWSLNENNICTAFAAIPVFAVAASCNIITNLAIIILPLPLFRSLRIQQRIQIVGLAVIFTLGAIVILASVIRLIILSRSATVTEVAVWSSVECALGIVIISLPSIRILLRKHRVNVSSPRRGRHVTTHSTRLGAARTSRPDWISLSEAEMGDLEAEGKRNTNRDTIKSHSTVLTFPTIEELDEIVHEKDGTQLRSIDDLQRWHDSVLFHRDPNETSTRPSYEWSFDKQQWRYSEPLPPSPIMVSGLGVLPDIPQRAMIRSHYDSSGVIPDVPPIPAHLLPPRPVD